MDPIAQHAVQVLEMHPHPALRFSELLHLVAERADRSLDAPRLRGVLERHAQLFRMLDPLRGPWRVGDPRRARRHADDPWVLLTRDPAGGGHPDPTCLVLRESMRWYGWKLDAASPSAVQRWAAAALRSRALPPRWRRAA